MSAPDHLLSAFQLGPLTLKNRMVLAPMTRGRAESDGTPTERMVPYYGMRADGGLLVTEATAISAGAVGWNHAPGIYTEQHVAGWRNVTDAVHENDGRIFLQLWHTGRVSHPEFLGGRQPVGPSAIAAAGEAHTPTGKQPHVTPRALTRDEIQAIVGEYATAARHAHEAGFDGVEVHAANGYLVDQFLRDGANQRDDDYGGSIENRARFLVEICDAISATWAANRVGVRVSPTGNFHDMKDSDPAALSSYIGRQLSPKGLAYLHLTEPLPGHMMHVELPPALPVLRESFAGPLITNGGYDADTAEAAIAAGQADLIAFGMPWLANPDLVTRYRTGAGLNAPDFETLYTPGDKGYLDYPTLTP